jgi:hypothetical protein
MLHFLTQDLTNQGLAESLDFWKTTWPSTLIRTKSHKVPVHSGHDGLTSHDQSHLRYSSQPNKDLSLSLLPN